MNRPGTASSESRGAWRRLSPHEPTAGGRAIRQVIVGMGWALLALIVVGWAAVIHHVGIATAGGAGLAAAGLATFLAIRTLRRRMAVFDRAMGKPGLWLPPAAADGPPRWGTPYHLRVDVAPRNLPDRAVLRARLWQAREGGDGTVRTLWEKTQEVARLAAGTTAAPDGSGSPPGFPVTWTLPKQDPAAKAPFSAWEPVWWITLEAYSEGPSSALGARWAVHFRLGPALP